ncbi:hypothetical protein LOTGIDRAFT_154500 [Lottia gigantea]|uniref:Uncharacterized protein n=1 Tax=Lottia gigantea TaxID=225164 RepID=V4BE03_LOTGI|nr:hypothetical protein LOTGIDRAFT_154500 [Lottia gigantea]ESO87019.1 hypothetical protein LOTGIDRAFT_154500 [Lottia gigantea]
MDKYLIKKDKLLDGSDTTTIDTGIKTTAGNTTDAVPRCSEKTGVPGDIGKEDVPKQPRIKFPAKSGRHFSNSWGFLQRLRSIEGQSDVQLQTIKKSNHLRQSHTCTGKSECRIHQHSNFAQDLDFSTLNTTFMFK